MIDFSQADHLLRRAVDDGAFPGGVVEVGRSTGRLWHAAFGALSSEADAPPTSLTSVYDLASLTKVICTTTLAMHAVDQQVLSLDDRLRDRLSTWRGDDRVTVSIADLLAHASGLTAYLPFFRDHTGRVEFEHAIATMPLEYAPRTRSVYSDLGFILLGFILEDVYGVSLAVAFERVVADAAWGELRFRPPTSWRERTAPTEIDQWRGRLLVGEVHDENAWALGGVAGHAGLFGTAAAVGRFARIIATGLQSGPVTVSLATFQRFMAQTDVPGSSRALGWDTMRPTSSCGTQMSRTSVGHTGFTGTSLWIDPRADVYIVLLTNRVHPSRDNDAILRLRPVLHDAVMHAMTG